MLIFTTVAFAAGVILGKLIGTGTQRSRSEEQGSLALPLFRPWYQHFKDGLDPEPYRESDDDRYLDEACEQMKPYEEALWIALSIWAFSKEQLREPPYPDESELVTLLQEIEGIVGVPQSAKAWRSVARCFQAENFHALERPALRLAHRSTWPTARLLS